MKTEHKILVWDTEGQRPLGKLGVGGRIILRWTLQQ